MAKRSNHSGSAERPLENRLQLDLAAHTLGRDGRSIEGTPFATDEAADQTARLQSAPAPAPWLLVQRIDDPDPARANSQARDDLSSGAMGLALVFAGAPNAFGYGLPASPEDLRSVLENILLQDIHLRIDVHPQSRSSIDWLVDFVRESRADPSRLSLSFGIDPASLFAGTGRMRMSLEAHEASMPQSLAGFFSMGLPGVLLEADGRVFHNAGATEAQELGAMLASAASYLRMFEEARQPLLYAAPHIGFAISVDQDQALSIAKIGALRKLWARMLTACATEPTPAFVHAETSYRMMTARDPEGNIIRNTMAAFAAAAGGANSISVLPHTIAHGLPDCHARRVARNAQLILQEECRLSAAAAVAGEPAGMTAGTIEKLCEDAWEEFRRIEAEGGILRSLAGDHLQKRIAAARRERQERYRTGEYGLVGTIRYSLEQERPVQTLAASPQELFEESATSCGPLPAMRIDEDFGPA